MGNVDRGLADPTYLERNQGSHQFLGLVEARRDIVINEKNHLPWLLDLTNLFNDAINWAVVVGGTEIRLDRTEVAFEAAAARKLDEPNWQILFATKNGTIRTDGQRRSVGAFVHLPWPTMAVVVNCFWQQSLRFANHDRLAVLHHLIGAQRRVKAAHHHGDAAFAILAGDLVGALRGVSLDANRY